MADILRIFKRDMCGIFRNVLVLIIVIGLCVLPALYAWFNIYANWDPYGNTGNIAIAVVNLDKGWTKNDSELSIWRWCGRVIKAKGYYRLEIC